MTRPDWAPEDVDISRPSAARMYDYYLGGFHNFAIDRELADQALQAVPDGRLLAQANRAFLGRAVRYLVSAGIRQFLDIGSGIPTANNVHEVAQASAPRSRVVYVDIDEVAVAHARRILADNPRATAVSHDLRQPESLLNDPELRALLDLDEPVAVLMCAVLHFVQDSEDPARIIGRLCRPLPSGSHLVISHGTDDGRSVEQLRRVYKRTDTPLTMRDRARVRALFDGFELLEPGVVWAPQWRPGSPGDVGHHPHLSGSYVGVARKR